MLTQACDETGDRTQIKLITIRGIIHQNIYSSGGTDEARQKTYIDTYTYMDKYKQLLYKKDN